MHKLESIIAALKQDGHRITHARKAIVELMLEGNGPMSAAELHVLLQKRGTEVNTVTVYRELAFLEDEGIVHGDTLKDGVKRYCNTVIGHHHHLVCTGCNAVEDIEMENDLDSLERKIRKEKSFNVKSHALEFYGLCEKCG